MSPQVIEKISYLIFYTLCFQQNSNVFDIIIHFNSHRQYINLFPSHQIVQNFLHCIVLHYITFHYININHIAYLQTGPKIISMKSSRQSKQTSKEAKQLSQSKLSKQHKLHDQILNKIPIFLSKTYKIIQNPHYHDIIDWNEDGSAFVIKDVNRLTGQILPKHFKHNNLASFVRQLNMYGFHKVKSDDEKHAFTHDLFQKDNLQKLLDIKRRNAPNSQIEAVQNTSNMVIPMRGVRQNQIQKELSQIRNKHENLQNCVSMLVDQNKQILMQNRSFVTKMTKMQQKYRNKLETLMLLLLFGKAKNNNGQPFILPKQFQNMLESLQQNGQFAQIQTAMQKKSSPVAREEPLMMLKNQSQHSRKMSMSPKKMEMQNDRDDDISHLLDDSDISGPERMMKKQLSNQFLEDSPYHIPPSPNHSFFIPNQPQNRQNSKQLDQILRKLDHSDFQIDNQEK